MPGLIPQERCAAVEQAWSETGPGPVVTANGVVDLLSLDVADGVVSVTVGDPSGGDPYFRIINPPTLVPDPDGPIERVDGTRWRSDPLCAVAHAIAINGGARRSKGRRG